MRQIFAVRAAIALVVASFPAVAAEDRALDLESFDVVWTTIRDRHFDPDLGGLDWQAVRDELRPRVAVAASREAARAVIEAMLERLGQSHFQVVPAEVVQALGREPSGGALGGRTGIDARVIAKAALVTRVRRGSPADRAGVRPGWEIVTVNGEAVIAGLGPVVREYRGRSWQDAFVSGALLARLTGEVGGSVVVGFCCDDGTTSELRLPLEEPPGSRGSVGAVAGIPVTIETHELAGGAGYIAFSGFLDPPRLMPVFNEAMRGFLDAPGVVLDLRGNEGGLGGMVTGMAGWFVAAKGRHLGTIRLRQTELKMAVFPRPETYAGPLAVLVDGLSASGAEVLAEGLQALGRARVFGEPSSGMVLASEVQRLPNGDAFQFVFADYVSVSGAHLEGRGVVPDVTVAPTRAALTAGRDEALEAALDWIQGRRADDVGRQAGATTRGRVR